METPSGDSGDQLSTINPPGSAQCVAHLPREQSRLNFAHVKTLCAMAAPGGAPRWRWL